MYSETVHCFGDRNILCGILTKPSNIAVNDLCVVFLNAGLVHKIAPFRMHVDMARALALMGVTAFRFDLSGLGDSSKRESNQADEERTMLDIKESFDYIEDEFGIKRFVTFGLCSGADNAHAVALVDQRIVGAVMLDGPGYPNLHYQISHYGSKVLQAKPWINTIRRLTNPDRTLKSPQRIYTRTFRPREQVENEISALAKRGVELLYIYSGGVETYYNHASQFMENFPSLEVNKLGSVIQHEYYGQADHVFSNLNDRALVFKRVLKWIGERIK